MMNDEKLDKMKLDYFNNHIKRPFHPEASALIFSPSILTFILVSTSNVSHEAKLLAYLL